MDCAGSRCCDVDACSGYVCSEGDKLGELRVHAFLLLKLPLPIQLMRPILHKRRKVRHDAHEDVADLLDDSIRLLPLVQHVPQADVHSDDVVDVPEHLVQELCPPRFRYDVTFPQGLSPELS